ncbi:MAG: PTS sugar transporter subunit IIA [Desulfohalobiaceae bacterium]|nr:PTS sugar transporter subunit IIA [Desulfohalobiaceae bacterium]
MQLSDYLDPDLFIYDLKGRDKSGVLLEMLSHLREKFSDLDPEKAHEILLERENLGSTGIGDGVAIPHGKMEELKNIVVIVGRSEQGVDFAALDTKPCHIFFLVLAPEDVAGQHLRILAQISRLLKDPGFRRDFIEAEDPRAFRELLKSI